MQTPDNVKVGDMFRVIGIGSYWGNCATWDIVSIKSDDSDWFPMLCNISRGWEEACVAWHYLEPYQEPTKEPTPKKIAVHTPTQESYDRLMRLYDRKGWRWTFGEKPSYRWFNSRGDCLYHSMEDNISSRNINGVKVWYKIITVDEAEQLLFPWEKKESVIEVAWVKVFVTDELPNPQPLSSITKKPMNALQTLRNKIFFTDKLGEKTNKIIEEAQELCKWYDSTANRASRAARKITGLIDALEGAYDSQDIKAYGDCKDKLEQVLAWIKKDPESLTLSQLGKKEVKEEEKYDASI